MQSIETFLKSLTGTSDPAYIARTGAAPSKALSGSIWLKLRRPGAFPRSEPKASGESQNLRAGSEQVEVAAAGEVEEDAHDGGVELRAARLGDAAHGLFALDGGFVARGARHAVEGLGERDDARLERDRIAGELLRVAVAVEPLVVVQHQRRDVGPELDRRQHAMAEHRVLARDAAVLELVRVEAQHADVVQQRREVQALAIRLREPELAADAVRQLRDTPRMAGLQIHVGVECRDQDVGHVHEEIALRLYELDAPQ